MSKNPESMVLFKTIGNYGSTVIDGGAMYTTHVDMHAVNTDFALFPSGRTANTTPACVDCKLKLSEFFPNENNFHPMNGVCLTSVDGNIQICLCDKCLAHRIAVGRGKYENFALEALLSDIPENLKQNNEMIKELIDFLNNSIVI